MAASTAARHWTHQVTGGGVADTMAELRRAVDVDAPIDQVWSVVTDWAGQHEWMLATTVRPVTGDGRHVGHRIEGYTGIWPVGVLDAMVITHWQPPYRCLVRHEGRVVRGSGSFEVLELPSGLSRFVWTEWLDPPLGLLGDFGFVLLRPLAARALAFSLARFARRFPPQ